LHPIQIFLFSASLTSAILAHDVSDGDDETIRNGRMDEAYTIFGPYQKFLADGFCCLFVDGQGCGFCFYGVLHGVFGTALAWRFYEDMVLCSQAWSWRVVSSAFLGVDS